MKVKFLQDFQGRETKEVFYRQGQEAELSDSVAQRLIADRRVVLVHAPEPVVFENVTGVEIQYFDNEPQFENAAEPPKTQRGKRGKK